MSSLSVLQGLASYVLPSHLLDYFDLVLVEERPVPEKSRLGVESGELVFHLEEHNEYRTPEDGHIYRPNGFYEASKVRDFPLRDKRVTLLIKRRRWVDESTGKSVGNSYDLTADGTRHSVEFAAFLKECFGQIPDISLLA